MSTPPVAVVGVGQTHHKSRRLDVSFGGLVREAVFRALDDAHMTLADIDAVVLGKAPDLDPPLAADRRAYRRTRRTLLDRYRYIVPGHGPLVDTWAPVEA